jgi:hypothetical protein
MVLDFAEGKSLGGGSGLKVEERENGGLSYEEREKPKVTASINSIY